jgi:hypothetical protein
MPETLGTETKTTFLNEVESHKLHLEFEVRAKIQSVDVAIKKGMPVKLHTDGTVQPMGNSDDAQLCIGVSLHDGVSGDNVTIGMKAYCVIKASANEGSFVAGPVKYYDYDATNERNRFSMTSITHANCTGWALTSATLADDEILVALAQ